MRHTAPTVPTADDHPVSGSQVAAPGRETVSGDLSASTRAPIPPPVAEVIPLRRNQAPRDDQAGPPAGYLAARAAAEAVHLKRREASRGAALTFTL